MSALSLHSVLRGRILGAVETATDAHITSRSTHPYTAVVPNTSYWLSYLTPPTENVLVGKLAWLLKCEAGSSHPADSVSVLNEVR